jgi:hypothetical protein
MCSDLAFAGDRNSRDSAGKWKSDTVNQRINIIKRKDNVPNSWRWRSAANLQSFPWAAPRHQDGQIHSSEVKFRRCAHWGFSYVSSFFRAVTTRGPRPKHSTLFTETEGRRDDSWPKNCTKLSRILLLNLQQSSHVEKEVRETRRACACFVG